MCTFKSFSVYHISENFGYVFVTHIYNCFHVIVVKRIKHGFARPAEFDETRIL